MAAHFILSVCQYLQFEYGITLEGYHKEVSLHEIKTKFIRFTI